MSRFELLQPRSYPEIYGFLCMYFVLLVSLLILPPYPRFSLLELETRRNPSLFISAALLSLMVMLRLELPHINVLSKVGTCTRCACEARSRPPERLLLYTWQ